MPRFEIIEARPWHCGAMARLLRIEHQGAMAGMSFDAHRELYARRQESMFCRSCLVDGRLAAMWGVTGAALSREGQIWLALSERARRYPIHIVKEAKRQIEEMSILKRDLVTIILGGDETAKRFAVFLGFRVAENGPGTVASSRFGRRDLMRYLDAEPETRIPLGSGYVIPMLYRGEAA